MSYVLKISYFKYSSRRYVTAEYLPARHWTCKKYRDKAVMLTLLSNREKQNVFSRENVVFDTDGMF